MTADVFKTNNVLTECELEMWQDDEIHNEKKLNENPS